MGDHKNVFAVKSAHDLHEEIHSCLQSFIGFLGPIRTISILTENELPVGPESL